MCLIPLIMELVKMAKKKNDPETEECEDGKDENASPEEMEGFVEEPSLSSMIDFKTQKGRNFFVVLVLGLSAAIDFVMSLMSIQAYYYLLGGEPTLYGLAFGIYDIGQFVFAPMFGWIADKTHSYFGAFALGIVLQIVGNVVYAMLFYIQFRDTDGYSNLGWNLMIVARLIAGAGSATLNLGGGYLTTHTSFDERFGAMGTFRMSQGVARTLGPMIGFIFISLPTPSLGSDASVSELLFNFYTIPGWVAAILSVITMIVLVALFRDIEPNEEAVEFNHKFDFKNSAKKPGSFLFGVFINSLVQLAFGFTIWALIGQFFGFGFAQYKLINSQNDIWKPYVGLGAGSVAATLFWRVVTPILKQKFPELKYSFAATTFLAVGSLLLVPYYPLGYDEPSGFLYAGSVVLGVANVWFFANQEISYSRQLTHSREIVGRDINKFMSLYGSVGAFARFLGPFLAGYAFSVVDKEGNPPVSGVETCEPTQTCCIGTSNYNNETCEYAGATIMVPILAAIGVCAMAFQFWYNSKLLTYPQPKTVTTESETSSEPDSKPENLMTTV